VRSDGSRDFANSPRRIPTVRSPSFSRTSATFYQSVFQRYLTACDTNLRRLLNAPMHKLPVLLFDNFEGFILPELFPTLSLKEDSCTHSLRKILQLLQRIEVLRLCALPAAVVSQQFLRFANSETLLGLRTPCTAPVPSCTSEGMRTKAILSELSETNL
jgi:hypothetical protein